MRLPCRVRLRGQHDKLLDATFVISYLSFFIYFSFLPPLLQSGAKLASSSSPSPAPVPILDDLN